MQINVMIVQGPQAVLTEEFDVCQFSSSKLFDGGVKQYASECGIGILWSDWGGYANEKGDTFDT